MAITASVATPETDREIQFREWQRGHQAAVQGLAEDTCPWQGGLCETWWRDGYHHRNFPPGMIRAELSSMQAGAELHADIFDNKDLELGTQEKYLEFVRMRNRE